MPSKWIPCLTEMVAHIIHHRRKGKKKNSIRKNFGIRENFGMEKKELYLYFSFVYKYAKISRPLPITLEHAFFFLS